jgi:hypothetical protein
MSSRVLVFYSRFGPIRLHPHCHSCEGWIFPGNCSVLILFLIAKLHKTYLFQAKYDQRRSQRKEAIIPLVRSEPVLNTLNLGSIQFNYPDSELISRHHPTFHTSQPYYNGFIPNYASQTYKNV